MHRLRLDILTRPLLKRALVVAFVVGTILNLINQGGAILVMEGVNGWHIGMNYLVPFLVSTYSAWAGEFRRAKQNRET